jgi:hypothetical protein
MKSARSFTSRAAQRGRFSCAELERRFPVDVAVVTVAEPAEVDDEAVGAKTSLVASITRATSWRTVAKAVEETETLVVPEEGPSPKEHSCNANESIPHTFSIVKYCEAKRSMARELAS